ncbi:hypothetical protein DPMN_089043 [Dreissena polymorpha]|uniref:Uncharacterized protein n=1 Tax=Dreissena polymorpha TaxID=45954 RepID=A0A9D4KV75_DREPO|nr:hypothetical protein DPMN_089043 [Dreissena polymorpha]
MSLNAVFLYVAGYTIKTCTDFNPQCLKTNKYSLECVNMFPEVIESEILKVEIGCFNSEVHISTKTFLDESWWKIQALRIYNEIDQPKVYIEINCFVKLKSLKELTINLPWSSFDYGALNGLDAVTLLDVSDCTRTHPDEFLDSLFNSSVLQLKRLAMSSFGRDVAHGAFHLTDTFWQFVKDRNVSSLDVSYVMIMEVNRSAFNENCDTLTDISLKGSDVFGLSRIITPLPKPCKNIRFVDISGIILPKHIQFLCQRVFPFENYNNVSFNMKKFINFWNAETVLCDKFCNGQSILIFKNITHLHTDIDCNIRWKKLSLNGFGLKVLDIQTDGTLCFLNNLNVLSVNDNNMEFVPPI